MEHASPIAGTDVLVMRTERSRLAPDELEGPKRLHGECNDDVGYGPGAEEMSGQENWVVYYLAAHRAQCAFVARFVIAGARSTRSALCLLFRPLIIRFRRRAALAELRAIDGRTLRDIGLHRGEMWFIADTYARGVPYRPDDPRHSPEATR